MFDVVKGILDNLPPLRGKKNEHLAALLGFAIGGIGLGIYLRSVIDFFVPVFFAVVLGAMLGPGFGWLGGALIAAIWGFIRVVNSNTRLVGAT